MKTTKPRYTVKQYIWLGVLVFTLGLLFDIVLFGLLGAPCRLLMITVIGFYTVIVYVILKSFHKGLVEHYGLRESSVETDPGGTGNDGPSRGAIEKTTKPRYSVKRYIWQCVFCITGCLLAGTIILAFLGASCRLLLIIVLVLYPVTIYVSLKRFHKWLVEHFGFRENRDGQEQDT